MTDTQKILVVAVIVLGILVAITIPPSIGFYFGEKNQQNTNGKALDLKDTTSENKTSETVKEITYNANSQNEQNNTNIGKIYQKLENSVVQITSTITETRSNIIINGNPLQQQASRLHRQTLLM